MLISCSNSIPRYLFGLVSRNHAIRSISHVHQESKVTLIDGDSERTLQAAKRKKRIEWKRRRHSDSFLDHLIITVRGGRGGDGCVAFHREKFKPFGPPSGGNGGSGGSVYIMPSTQLTSLTGVSKRVIGGAGGHGQGTWQHGRAGSDVILKVPYGTVIREVMDSRRAKDAWEAEEESYDDQNLTVEERRIKRRQRRWVHYPEYEDDNIAREDFRDAEAKLAIEERQRRAEELDRRQTPIFIDFGDQYDFTSDEKRLKSIEEANKPLGLPRSKNRGILVASGGAGGHGNPYFLTPMNRSPKIASRGHDGIRLTLELELKLIADVGLVGFPNAGKSTLLSALTKRRPEVAAYAFTTLSPQIGTVRVFENGEFDGGGIIEESWLEREQNLVRLSEGLEETPRQPRPSRQTHEVFRFTIADNPGLIGGASENIGLGHDFLRSIERARALAYVVDLNGDSPIKELDTLRNELENYQVGLSSKCKMVIANKADLLGPHLEDPDDRRIEEARSKLSLLEAWVHENFGPLDVVPVSAKYNQNLRRVVKLLSAYVDESRQAQSKHAQEASPTVPHFYL
ncbi:hypothetical protein Clacol_009044 [Clathrus columnatus]|uniref:Mitochondrial ribosome-associated GTPase 2 n=1 Tax=Clathrus columnatus TaxID=1419009 RepID=A0AAV5AJF6_9AGAM|nr:hypothetical protein Clacol_009044 [Clathrus columnatus]